jgi:hypothetical protein
MPIFEGPIQQDDFAAQQRALNDKVMRLQWRRLEETLELEKQLSVEAEEIEESGQDVEK